MNREIEAIWLDLSEELYQFIVGKTKDDQLAQDLHQEVFLKVHTKIDQLKQLSKFTAWVYQITRNVIVDYFRKLDKLQAPLDPKFDMPTEANDSFDYAQLAHCINQKIAGLSAQHQEAIVLTSFKNYSQKELAAHLNISYSGTKSRVQKARDILKNDILNCPNVEADDAGNLLDFENN